MSLPDDLMAPGLELRQTHISWVYLSSTEVWKVKRPVDLGFLDFTTIEKRREACENEVALNRRLAPSVYLGVVPVRRSRSDGLSFEGAGEVVDWAVHMKRLPERDRADLRLADGRMSDDDIEAIARRLAAFHERSRHDERIRRFGSIDVIEKNVRENFEQVESSIRDYVSDDQVDEIESWQIRFLRDRRTTFEARVEDERIRDGHGDLRLEHVYLTDAGQIAIIDCIEFNERFRFADVCADVVFLAMDLAYSGRVDVAERFVALYAREANDFDLYGVADFYESYRAFVRGKIASFVASSSSTDPDARNVAEKDARRYFLLALASERRPIAAPMMVVVGGVIASGKSTVSSRLGAAHSIPVVDADRTRKHLAGVASEEPVHEAAWGGIYSETFGEATYAELVRRARSVLESGRSVIVEASFRARRHREKIRALAEALRLPFFFVECRADTDTCKQRLAAREGGVSDGRLDIFDDFMRGWEPVVELSREEHIVVDTSASIEQTMALVRERLPVDVTTPWI